MCCFLAVEVMDSSMEMTIPWLLCHAYQPTSYYPWLCLMGILGLKPVLNVSAHIDMFLMLFTQEVGKNLAAVCCVFRLSFRMPWMDLDIPDMVATSQLGFVFLSVLLINGCVWCLESSVLGHMFWTEMTLKNLCCSCYLLSRSFSQHFRSSCSIFSNLK